MPNVDSLHCIEVLDETSVFELTSSSVVMPKPPVRLEYETITANHEIKLCTKV